MNRIPIVFCFDESYARYAAVSIFSVLTHCPRQIVVYCMVQDVTDESKKVIVEIADKFNARLEFINVNGTPFKEWKEMFHIKRSSYLRLLIPEFLSQERVIYLDSDLLLRDDISKLYGTQFDATQVIAGVVDPAGEATSKLPRPEGDHYINSGVLLMNLDSLRKDSFRLRCEQIYQEYEGQVSWADQCIINKYAENRKLLLDTRWNTQVFCQDIRRADWIKIASEGGASIIHFVGPTKPWSGWCNPTVSELWWSYARRLDLPDLKPIQASQVGHLLSLATALDRDEEFQASGEVKNRIINVLLAKLREYQELHRTPAAAPTPAPEPPPP